MSQRKSNAAAKSDSANANEGVPVAPETRATPPCAGEDDLLTPVQRQAIESLTRGRSIKSAAAQAGIGRRTLHRWLREDHAFRAAYNSWKAEVQESAHARLLSLANAAVDTMGHAIHKRDARAAHALLKGLSILSPNAPGPEDPDEARRMAELERVRREAAMMESENEAWKRRRDASDSFKRDWRLRDRDKAEEEKKVLSEKEAVELIRQIKAVEKEEREEGL